MMREKWTDLIRHWVERDVEGITQDIARMTRDDAEELVTQLWALTRLMIEAKEIL
jgi:hypothetical protein